MNLKKDIQYYDTGEIFSICLIDENGKAQGEYTSYNKNGSIYRQGFCKDDFLIGKYYSAGKYYFKSFINLRQDISEQEHKKELAMVRLGLIDYPIQLSYLLKDYNENGKNIFKTNKYKKMKYILKPIVFFVVGIFLTLTILTIDIFFTIIYFLWNFKIKTLYFNEYILTKNEWQEDEYCKKYKSLYHAIWFPRNYEKIEN